jgi:hypothetical protein
MLINKYNLHRVFERTEVLKEVNIKVLVFWDVTRCYGTDVPMLERNLLSPSIHSFIRILSDDRSKAYSKTIPPHSAI